MFEVKHLQAEALNLKPKKKNYNNNNMIWMFYYETKQKKETNNDKQVVHRLITSGPVVNNSMFDLAVEQLFKWRKI